MRKYGLIKEVVLATMLFGLAICATPAQAVLLEPGDLVSLPGTTVAAEPQLAGVVLIDENIPFSFSSGSGLPAITGSVLQRVVRAVDGTVDFYWFVTNDASSANAIGSFRLGNFVSPEYNANWRLDGVGTKAPNKAFRFSWGIEDYVNFNFDPGVGGLLPGETSRGFFFDTTATSFAKTAIFDVTDINQSHISGLFAAYSPSATPVPEPGMLLLLGCALTGMAALGCRFRK